MKAKVIKIVLPPEILDATIKILVSVIYDILLNDYAIEPLIHVLNEEVKDEN
jgi:hypothetical protein